MKKILFAISVIVANSLHAQKTFISINTIEGCFTNNHFVANINFDWTLPTGSEQITLYMLPASKRNTLLLLPSSMPIYSTNKKAATFTFSLSDSLYNLLYTYNDSLFKSGNNDWSKYNSLVLKMNNAIDDTLFSGLRSHFIPKDSIKLQTNGFFINVLNTKINTFDLPFSYKWSKDNNTLTTIDTTSLLALSEGTYSLLLQSKHCSANYSIKFNPVSYDAGNLIVPFVQGASYQWYYKGQIVSGANKNTYTTSQIGGYSVEVTFPTNFTFSSINNRLEEANIGVYNYNLTSVITGFDDIQSDLTSKTITRIYTPLGESINQSQVTIGLYVYQYSDGSTRKVMISEK